MDNGSTDDSVPLVRDSYPEVNILALGVNTGFAGGVNAGIRNTASDLVFLLNNDTVLDRNCLDELSRAAQRHHQVSFFATKMLFQDDSGIINAAGDSFGIDGQGRNIGIREPDDGRYDEVTQVFGACAGAALYRRSFFQDVGLFDEEFFLIHEDVDLDFRAQIRGHQCYYIPTAIIHHLHSASIGRNNSLQTFHNARNSLFVLAKNMPASLLVKYFWRILRNRQQLLGDSIIFGQARAWIKGETGYSLRTIQTALRRFKIQLHRRVTTREINAILVDPDPKG